MAHYLCRVKGIVSKLNRQGLYVHCRLLNVLATREKSRHESDEELYLQLAEKSNHLTRKKLENQAFFHQFFNTWKLSDPVDSLKSHSDINTLNDQFVPLPAYEADDDILEKRRRTDSDVPCGCKEAYSDWPSSVTNNANQDDILSRNLSNLADLVKSRVKPSRCNLRSATDSISTSTTDAWIAHSLIQEPMVQYYLRNNNYSEPFNTPVTPVDLPNNCGSLDQHFLYYTDSSLGKDNSSEDKCPVDKIQMMHNYLIDQWSKFFTAKPSYKIYTKDLVFINNWYFDKPVTTHGLVRYAVELSKIKTRCHLKFAKVKLTVIDSHVDTENSVITIHSRVSGIKQSGILRFWKFIPGFNKKAEYGNSQFVDFISKFELNKHGLIVKHKLDRVIIDDESSRLKNVSPLNKLTEMLAPKPGTP